VEQAPPAPYEPAPFEPAPFEPAPFEPVPAPAPTPEPAPVAYARPATSAFEPVVREVQDPPATSSFDPVTPAPAPREALAPAAPGTPGKGAFQELPAFEDLIADLPTRRAARESEQAQSGRKRGLFGRKPSTEEPAAPAASTPFPASMGVPEAPRPAASPFDAAPAPYEAPREEVRPEQREEPATTSYGGSVLPLRPTETGGNDPLDPHFVPDTVEARSEWMASAVLYEEMSTMLQRGVFQEGNVTSTNDEQTYRPTTVSSVSGGLARRQRAGESSASTERFTARIERDPEQLRSRLSAFQSATSRGRDDAGALGASTPAAPTVNDVPGSAPQQR
jgi:hypothetical protein